MSGDFRSPTFGSVFLTLISIVVALGIEQLLGHISVQIAWFQFRWWQVGEVAHVADPQ